MSGGMAGQDGSHTIGRWLTDRAAQSPARIAIDDRGVTIDYAGLAARAVDLADGLRRVGYGPGSRLATISGNSIDHVVAFFACALAGVAFVPLSWRLTARELGDLLRRTDPALVLVDDEYASLAAEALRGLEETPPVTALGSTGVEGAVPLPRGARPTRHVRDDDPLLIIFTSGSEAAPKGVVLTHANCFWNNLALGQALPLTQDDVVLAMLPQFHVAAWNCQPLLAWWIGATVVLERSFQPARALQLIGDRRVTAMMGVPTQYAMLTADREWAATDVSCLRLALVGGATVPPELHDAWAARGLSLTQGYGLTEAAPNVLHLPAHEAAAHPGAVGRPYPHVGVLIADPESLLPLEGEATGELWVRGPSVFAGYLEDEAATATAMAGEWLRTGDLVHRSSSGVFRVVDRIKDIYISGGENVAPAEVELALCLHPLIDSAAVVGVADPVWGERGVAFVVPTAGAVLSVDEVLAHARRNLAAFKIPVHVEIVTALPRSTIEKLARPRLRERARELVEGARYDDSR
ncbi:MULTISPECIES: AMP-binding protein [unclassified Microbacterium]|uniref:class I adenylate-forming enzyme family protein n=1 Tax=unclassified Microbacterium TaxID=2609290 RepID=UPI00214C119C|nr:MULTISPECIES: AMP-binding protein [unclassified Microbacterium]MCR2809298.1 AMP-binding protein [Microbacterium sp. zg.B185]WIM20439.1 AMP-binding protein [Microbacterium sp. zg-B185]